MKLPILPILFFAFHALLVADDFSRPGNVPVDWPGLEKFQNHVESQAAELEAKLNNGVVNFHIHEKALLFRFPETSIVCNSIASLEVEDANGTRKRLAFKRISPYSSHKYVAPEIPIRHADALDEDGSILKASFENEENRLRFDWKISLRGNAPYFIQNFSFSRSRTSAPAKPIRIVSIRLGEFSTENLKAIQTIGKVPGSPVALGENILCGIEHPGFVLTRLPDSNRVALDLECDLALTPNDAPIELSSMIGYFPKSQQRRAFNFYLERERATPSRHFLVHNGWYAFGLSPTEAQLTESVEAYGNALVKNRNISIDAFVLDDGWDDPATRLWNPSPQKFPNGLLPLTEKAKAFGAGFGIWISPTGGYFGVKERLASCKKLDGIAADAPIFDLADPLYKNWFAEKCRTLIRENNVSFFKWDRVGENLSQHFLNLFQIAKDLRKIRPTLFINATVGTWPSPFWLNHVDSTWRGGADIAFYNRGIGDKRDQWISYRDFELIGNVVNRAPLYPINSVMHHGIALGVHYQGAVCAEAGNDLRREIFSYFALGPNLQELYIDFHLLDDVPAESRAWAQNKIKTNPNDRKKASATREAIRKANWLSGEIIWDCIAQAKTWASENAPALTDMHWVKGSPCNPPGAYAFAGWHRGNGVIYLRNASDKASEIEFSLEEAFELPPTEAPDATYLLHAAYIYRNDAYRIPAKAVPAKEKIRFSLKPLEVRILEARRTPAN